MKVDLRGYNIHSTNINFQVGANSCDQLQPNVKVVVTPDQDILGLISEEGECILSFLTHCNTDKNRYLRLITGVNKFFFLFIPLGIRQMEYQIAAPMALKLHLKVQPKYINCDSARKTYMGVKKRKSNTGKVREPH